VDWLLNHSFCCMTLLCLTNMVQAQSGPNLLANPSFEIPASTLGTYAPEASTLVIILFGGVSSIGVFSQSRRGLR